MTERLEEGREYQGAGRHGLRIRVEAVDEAAGRYRVKGKGQVAPVVLFGCEHFWRPIEHGPPAPESEPAATPLPTFDGPAWHLGRLVAFDLETTSADPLQARIVTAAIAAVGGDAPPAALDWLADPGVEIPAEATEIHGITTEHARAKGDPIADVLEEVLETLTSWALEHGRPLVIYNARYDLTVLDREARRHGLEPLTERGFPVYVIDPFVIDKHLDLFRRGGRKLADVCAHYGAKLEEAHTAAADAIAAARLAWVLGAKGFVVRAPRSHAEQSELLDAQAEWARVRHDLAALHEAQRVWARSEQLHLAGYFRDVGDPERAAGVAPHWPVIPYTEATP